MFGAGARLHVTLQPATMLQNIANHLVALLALSFSLGHCLNEEDFQYLLKEVKHLRSRQDVLEERVEKLEELAKIGTLRTCAEYAQYGLKTSGLYMVDPDGPLLGHPPFQVFCNFDDGIIMNLNYYEVFKSNFPGTTEIMHDSETSTVIDHCHDPGKIK